MHNNEFRGKTLAEAVRDATAVYRKRQLNRCERKATYQVWAPPLFWGQWVDIYTQFGVAGPKSDTHLTRVHVTFETRSNASSTFDIEIIGGDKPVRTYGPGAEEVTITGNVATTIRARVKSHSLGQNVFIDVR